MSRERSPSREAVFDAADAIARRGGRVTVTAVRDEIGGRTRAEAITEQLVAWRRERRDAPGSANGLNHSGANGASAPNIPLPDPIQTLLGQFSARLSMLIADSVAAASTNDQLAVIRAAAEARVRQAVSQSEMLELDLVTLQDEVASLRAERDGLAASLETANDRAVEAQQAEMLAQQQLRDVQEMATQRLASLKNERDALVQEREALQLALAEASTAASHATEHQPQRDLRESTPDFDRRALLEAVRVAERTRDLLRIERDRLAGEVNALSGERGQLIADVARFEQDVLELQERVAKQQAWMAEARARMERAGILRPAAVRRRAQ